MLIRSCPNQERSNEWMYIFVRSILAEILSGHRKIATSLVNYRVRLSNRHVFVQPNINS